MIKKQLLALVLFMSINSLIWAQSASVDNQIGKLKWKFKTSGKLYSSPTISQDKAFVGSDDGKLYAIDLKSGKEIWHFKTKGAVSTKPALFEDTIYIGSTDGYYYALDISSGKELWRFKTEGQSKMSGKGLWGMQPTEEYMEDQYDLFISSPTVYPADKSLTIYFGSSDGYLYAIDKEGKLKWKFKTNGIIRSTPVLYNNRVYFGSWDTYVYSLDATDGKLIWKFKTESDNQYNGVLEGIIASATLANGYVYIGSRDGFFYALNAETGAPQWKFNADNTWVVSTAAVKDSIVYITTSDSYLFIALNAYTGQKLYSIKTQGYNFSSITLNDNHAYFGDFSGKLYRVNLVNQYIDGVFETENRKILKGKILDKSEEVNFAHIAGERPYELYETTVHFMNELYKLGPIVAGPVISDNSLYMSSTDGNLYAFEIH